ncbi:MAG: LamG-like jellyroll fold domain-containing protein, partial [Pirellulaceae bacterium]|nr:LamG-like jellyroll fold domain-containing protein [Pirellulaceae bacterium]
MPLSADQFAKALIAAGLSSAGEIKTFWNALPAGQKPKDGETLAKRLVEHGKLTPFQSEELLSGTGTPLVLGDYILLAKIGAGGMGQVFKAQHRHMDRLVAIKLLPAALTKDAAAVQRFQREVKAAARLSHPNIVQAHDASVQRGVWYLVMEYVEGRDLSGIIAAEGPLPVERAVDYVRQAARGLAFAHGEGVVHRDIKPANLLLDKKGTVKILDMGLARFDSDVAAQDGLTQSGQVMGTVDFMAPEQAFDTHTADARADIYSLGCTLYRLISGRNLYDGETLVKKLMAHQTAPIPSLLTHKPDAPAREILAALDPIFQKMVAKKPEDRYATMAEVEAALAVLGGQPSGAASAPFVSRPPTSDSHSKSANPGAARLQPTIAGIAALTQAPAAPDGNAATVALVNPLHTTDPVSARSIQLARENTPRPVAKAKNPPWWRGHAALIAGGLGGLLLIALGIWVIVRDKDGNKIAEIKVPEGGSVTVAPTPGDAPQPTAVRKSGEFALQLGEGSYVDVPSFEFTGDPPLTLEAWVTPQRFDPDPKTSSLITMGAEGDVQFKLKLSDGEWTAVAANAGEFSTSSLGAELGKRTHVAAVWGKNSQLRVYVNGKPGKSAGIDPAWRVRGPLRLGGTLGIRAATLHEVRISKAWRYQGATEFTPEPHFVSDADTLALYHFDEGAGDVLKDSSGNNHHGKIVGAKWVRADGSSTKPPDFIVDSALQFDVSKSAITLPGLVSDAAPCTLECRIKKFGTNIMPVVRINGRMPVQFHLAHRMPHGAEFGLDDKLHRDIFGPRVPESDEWTYLAYCVDAEESRLYVNGKLVKRQAGSPVVAPTAKITDSWIGYELPNATNSSRRFDGVVDEIRFSSTSRYNEDYTPLPRFEPDTHTLALYHFDEGVGDVLEDSSGNGYHGKIVGAKWVRVGRMVPADVTPNELSLAFDGKARVEVSGLPLDVTKPLTIEGFVELNQSANVGHVFSAGPPEFGLRFDSQRQCEFFWLSALQLRSQSVPLNRRTHVAAVLDTGVARLCVDGRVVQSRPINAANLKAVDTSVVQLGREFQGRLDEIRISRIARYGEDFPPPTRFHSDADTLALYHFDEGAGDVLRDSSGNNHHGKIVGAKWVRAEGADSPRAALEWLFAIKAQVLVGPLEYLEEIASYDEYLRKSKPITVVTLNNPAVTDNDLARLLLFPEIDEVKLVNVPLGKDGLAHVAKLPKLARLSVSGSKVTDPDLSALLASRSLTSLHVGGNPLTAECLKKLRQFTGLKSLALDGLPVTDASLAELKKLPNLTHLQLISCEQLTDACGTTLAQLVKLESLRLDGTKLGDEGVQKLSELKSLSNLSLYGVQVTDATVPHLSRMKSLKNLGAQGTKLSAAGVKQLVAALPQCVIASEHGVFKPMQSTSIPSAPPGATAGPASRSPRTPLPDGPALEIAGKLTSKATRVRLVAAAPDGVHAALAVDYGVQWKKLATDELVWNQPLSQKHGLVALAISPDGKFVAAGGGSENLALGAVYLYRSEDGALLHTHPAGSPVCSAEFSPDSARLAVGLHDGTIRLLDVPSWSVQRTLAGHTTEVRALAFSGDGRRLASGSSAERDAAGKSTSLKLWNTADGSEIALDAPASETSYFAVRYLADGRTLVLGTTSASGELREPGKPVVKIFNPKKQSSRLVVPLPSVPYFLFGGNHLQIASQATGKVVHEFAEHSLPLESLDVTPDGRFALTVGDHAKEVVVWRLPPECWSPGAAAGLSSSAPPPAVAPFDAQQAKAHQQAWADYLGTKIETTNSVGQTMILIPPGEFLMGSSDEQIAAALKAAEEFGADQATKDRIQKAERPQHRVVLTKPFLMSATEVTVGQFKRFSATGYVTEAEKAAQDDTKLQTYLSFADDDLPAAFITWNDAVAYCKWLTEHEATLLPRGEGGRRPEEGLPAGRHTSTDSLSTPPSPGGIRM